MMASSSLSSLEDECDFMTRLLKFLTSSSAAGKKKMDVDTQQFSDWITASEAVLQSNPDSLQIRRIHNSIHGGSMLHRFIAMLRDCMLAHRYREATQVLLIIVERVYVEKVGTIVLNAGLELFTSQSSINDRWLQTFTKHLKTYSDLREKPVCIALFLLEMGRGRFDEAKKALELNLGKLKREAPERKKKSALYTMYRGLVSYIDWSLIKCSIESETINNERYSSGHTVESKRQQMAALARTAMDDFDESLKEPGTWDIFIDKYITLLVHHGNITLAQTVLQSYASTNPYNPNAWKYLYYFYKRYNDSTLARQALEELAALNPCDELVLNLYDFTRLRAESNDFSYIKTLFDLLDWFDVEDLWQNLAEELVTRLEQGEPSEDFRIEIENSWKLRYDYWPVYYFIYNEKNVNCNSTSSEEMCTSIDSTYVYKAVVAHFLLGKLNSFTMLVKEASRKKSYARVLLHRARKLKPLALNVIDQIS